MFKDSWSRLTIWWSDLTGRQQLGYGLSGSAILLTFGLGAWRAGGQPSAAWLIGLSLAGILSQGAAAFSFGSVGKADPAHAQASVVHLLVLEQQTRASLRMTEEAYEAEPSLDRAKLREKMGMLSRDLSFINEGARQAVTHWELFHEKAAIAARDKATESELEQ